MNNKIPLKQLAEAVALQTNMPVDKASQFIKDLFAVVANRLAKGEKVDIADIGTFVTTSNSEEPVRFIPCSEFADEINAPFAFFEAMPLSDNLTDEDLVEITAKPTEEKSDEPTESEPEPILTEPLKPAEPQNVEPVIEPVVEAPEPVATSPVEVAVEQTVEVVPAEEAPTAHELPQEPETSPEVVEAAQEVVEVPEEETTAEMTAEPIAEPKTFVLPPPLPITPDVPDLPEVPAEPEKPAEPEPQPAPQPKESYIPEDEEEFVEPLPAKSSRFRLGFFLGLLVGIVLSVLAVVAYFGFDYFLAAQAVQ